MKVRVNSTLSAEFESTLGSFQGDSLSGCLFTLTFAGGLNHLRAVLSTLPNPRPNPPISDLNIPLETTYADDANFNDEEKENLEVILPIATKVLAEWNLYINETKTEYSHFYLATKDETNADKTLYNNEEWRKSITLGSQMCSTADIAHRCILGNVAFRKFNNIWIQGPKIPLSKKLIIYEAQVVSVIMYSSWAAPKHVLNKLDTCHRRHLRSILNIKWPTAVISNQNLYKLCDTIPLSERVEAARWSMLGHVLRSPETTPVSLALHFAVIGSKKYKGRRGAHRTNLLSILKKDLKKRNITLSKPADLLALRHLAEDRTEWKRLSVQNNQSCD